MSENADALLALRDWYLKREPELLGQGFRVEFTESPAGRMKPSASVAIESDKRIGQLTIWATGEAELSLAEIETQTISEQHREITSHIGFRDAIDTLMTWLGEG